MPRRGWSALETPASLYQVIRGPRPKSEDLPRAHQHSWWRFAHWQLPPVSEGRQPKSGLRPQQVPRRWHRGQSGGTRQNPDEVVANAQSRAERLQSAMDACFGRVRVCSCEKGWLQRCNKLSAQLKHGHWQRNSKSVRPSSSVPRTGCPVWSKNASPNKQLWTQGLALLAKRRQEMLPTENAVPVTIPNGTEDPVVVINQLRARVAEMDAECEGLRKKRTRSFSVPSPDMPGVDQSMSVWGPEPDRRSVLMQTLIDQGSFFVPKYNRFSPL